MAANTDDRPGAVVTFPILRARREFSKLIALVEKKQRVILTRHGARSRAEDRWKAHRVAVVVPPEDVDAILTSGDVPADQLAAYVLGQFPKDDPSLEKVDRWATDMGTIISRSCAGSDGEERFASVWKLLASDPLAAFDWRSGKNVIDPCARRFPYGLMRMLRRERQLVVDAEAQSWRIKLTTPIAQESVFARIIGLDIKKWTKPMARVDELGEELRDSLKGRPLIIGQSGYHEERILARLACDLFLTAHGYAGLQIAQAPWAFGRTVSNALRPVMPGGADIRLVNKDIEERRANGFSPEEKPDDAAIFRHLGYRAYANAAWLARIASSEAPDQVKNWIARVRDTPSADRGLFDPDSFPARFWILMMGRPVNYRNTEFALLFDFLSKNFKADFDPPPSDHPESTIDPDQVFDEFLRGERHVFMGGSIHDLLLEKFWISSNKTFVKIIDRSDFEGSSDHNHKLISLSAHIGRPPGQNVLMLSPRLQGHQRIVELVRELYRELANIVGTAAAGSAE